MEKLSFLRVKKWNIGWVLLIFAAFRVLKEFIHQFANIGQWLAFIKGFTFVSSNKGLVNVIDIINKHFELIDEAVAPFGLAGTYVLFTVLGYGVMFALIFIMMKINDMEYKDEDTYPWDLLRAKWLQIVAVIVTIIAITVPVILVVGGVFQAQQIRMTFVALDFIFGNMLMYIFLLNYLLKKIKWGPKARFLVPCASFVVIETVLYAVPAVGLKLLGKVGHEFLTPVASAGESVLEPMTKLLTKQLGSEMGDTVSLVLLISLLVIIFVVLLVGMWIYSGTQNILYGVIPTFLVMDYVLIAIQTNPRTLLSAIALGVVAVGISLAYFFWGILSFITAMKRTKQESME